MENTPYLNTNNVQQSFVDSADTWHFTYGKVTHKGLNRVRIELELKLPIRFVLWVKIVCRWSVGKSEWTELYLVRANLMSAMHLVHIVIGASMYMLPALASIWIRSVVSNNGVWTEKMAYFIWCDTGANCQLSFTEDLVSHLANTFFCSQRTLFTVLGNAWGAEMTERSFKLTWDILRHTPQDTCLDHIDGKSPWSLLTARYTWGNENKLRAQFLRNKA